MKSKPTLSIPESNNISFLDQQFKQTISSYKYILDTYKKGIDAVKNLESGYPIFLDTSAILSVYEVAFSSRIKIKDFFKSRQQDIFLTALVQFEFIKNREKVINTFQSDVTEQLPKNFKSEILNKLRNFNNQNKAKLEDYPEIWKSLKVIEDTVTKLSQDIENTVNDKKGSAHRLFFEDDFLETLSKANITERLDPNYIKKLQSDYEKLKAVYKVPKNDDPHENYSLSIFPGCAEKGGKDDPTSDFIIFHEMMKYANENKRDVIFLTNDTTKGDWLKKDGNPYFHYIENFFLNTGQIIYILNAESTLERILDASFESLLPNTSFKSRNTIGIDFIIVENLQNFLNSTFPFNSYDERDVRQTFIDELSKNGIIFIDTLYELLPQFIKILATLNEFMTILTQTWALRCCLMIFYDDYKVYKVISEDSKFFNLKRKYNHYISGADLL